jgi:hypothetical protein
MGSVSGSYAVGGLVGYDDDGFITDCYATGPVIGGVVGILVGGLVGYDYSGTLTCCYSTGQVSGDRFNIGGLVGSNDGASIGGCFWDMTTSGLTTSEGGIGKTTAQMKSLSTFISAPASWDFLGETANGTKDVWRMCVDGVNYPKLAWEYSGHGDFVCPDGVGLIDYAVLANAWMSESGEGAFNSACDISAVPDGKIDLADLAVFAGHWME